MNKYAVLIGNSQFPDESDKSKLPDLACPVQDVDGLAKVLASERGEFDVLALKNEPSYKILRELQRKLKQAATDDLFLLYYSGHGKPNKSNILHLTTFDTVVAELATSAISMNRIYEILSEAKCRKIVIILDCCYSGAAGQGFKGAVDDQLQQLNNARGTYLVTASTELQVAHESAAEGLSLFTKHLIAGLETGEADKDGDGWVSMNELYDYVQSNVISDPVNYSNQQPTKHVKEERGGLLIAKSGRDSETERLKKIKHYFYDLAKEDKITDDILTTVSNLLKGSPSDFSPLEQQQNSLVIELFDGKMVAVEFVRKWDRLTFEIERARDNAIQEQLKQEKLEQERKEQEKATQERLNREKLERKKKQEQEQLAREKLEREKKVQEKAAKEKEAQEKTNQVLERLAREKAAQEKLAKETAAREKAEQEKATQIKMTETQTEKSAKKESILPVSKSPKKWLKYSMWTLILTIAGGAFYQKQKHNSEGWKTIDRYQIKEELVKDTETGLMWMRCSMGQKWDGSTCQGKATGYRWNEAMKIPKAFTYAKYSNWRVPTPEELKTLVYCSSGKPKIWNKSVLGSSEWNIDNPDGSCEGNYAKPTILSSAFPQTQEQYWTFVDYYQISSDHSVVSFQDGSETTGNETDLLYVRLVRSEK